MTDEEEIPGWFLWLWSKGLLGVVIVVAVVFIPMIALSWFFDARIQRIHDRLQDSRDLRYEPPRPTSRHGDRRKAVGETVYVPVYSHVYHSGGQPLLLETLLSVRNTDQSNPVSVTAVKYYDTSGKLVKDYLGDAEVDLAPLQTIEYLVEGQDATGGSGANFLVHWEAAQEVSAPIVEAVMIGRADSGPAVSFITEGRVLSVVGTREEE